MTKKQPIDDPMLRERLTPEQYAVTQQSATEPAFSGRYYDEKSLGIYHCIVCGESLFNSAAKYDSGSGWPSFHSPMQRGAVETRPDNSHGMQRTEAVCANCDAHLWHVFEDGPQPTGLRFCINSNALELEQEDVAKPDDQQD
ncbi:MAG: peptide-methionine (R)-S-oxide reductase MsrB [Gammaproteobacteria bacterium]